MANDRRGPLAVGILSVVMGAALFLAAADIIPQPDEKFGAPRWMVAGIALAFCFAGFYVLSLVLATPVTRRVLATVTSLTFVSAAAILVTWLAWTGGGGGRTTVLIGPFSLLLPAGAARGVEPALRWFFAALTDAFAVAVWLHFLRALVRRRLP